MKDNFQLVFDLDHDITADELRSLQKLGDIIDIIPIIFPPTRNFYFFSDTITKSFSNEWGKRIRDVKSLKFKISSIYDTCGTHPLFCIIKQHPGEDIRNLLDELNNEVNERLNPEMFSFTSAPEHIEKRLGVLRENYRKLQSSMDKDLSRIPDMHDRIERAIYDGYQERKISIDNIKTRMVEERERVRANMARLFRGESHAKLANKYIKFTPIINIPHLSIIFINVSPKDDMERIKSMANVIDVYRIVGKWDYAIKVCFNEIQELYDFITLLHEGGNQTVTKTALRIWREEFWSPEAPFLAKDPHPPLTRLEEEVINIFGRNESNFIFKNHKEKIDALEDRIDGVAAGKLVQCLARAGERLGKLSFKMDREGWSQNIVFIKATLGNKEKLKELLSRNFLGATQTTFARRYYQITGNFDFLILADSYSLWALRDRLAGIEREGYVEEVRISELIPFQVGIDSPKKLTLEETAWLNALSPNVEGNREIEENSTRTRFYNHSLYESLNEECRSSYTEIKSTKKTPNGIEYIQELDPHKMIHVFVRFKIAEDNIFRVILDRKKKELGTLLKIYEPMHYPNVVMCIVTANDYKTLFEFIRELDACSRATEVSLIFHQGFYLGVKDEVRCKPCIYPKGSPCIACSRYLRDLPGRIVKPEEFKVFRGKMERSVIVDLIPISTTEDDYVRLARENINHENEMKLNKKQSDMLLGCVGSSLRSGADIIVFPELSFTEHCVGVFDKSLKRVIEKNIEKRDNKESSVVIVAGSYYKTFEELREIDDVLDGRKRVNSVMVSCVYNVAPIYFYRKGTLKTYEQYKKNTDSPVEIDFFNKLKAKGIYPANAVLCDGTGTFIFESDLGRMSVMICYDLTDTELKYELNSKIDYAIVVSWEQMKKSVRNRCNNSAREELAAGLIFANNGLYGGSGLYGPYQKSISKKGEDSLLVTQSKSKTIKRIYIGDKISEYQKSKGIDSIKDDHYVYAKPRVKRRKRIVVD